MASNSFLPSWGAGFDPTQLSNPYSLYKSQALPWPASFRGPATNARGEVIASAPPPTQTSINSTPTAAAASAARLTPVLQQGDGRDSSGRGAQLATAPGSIIGYMDPISGQTMPLAAGQLPQGMDAQTQASMIGPLGMQHLQQAGIAPAGQTDTPAGQTASSSGSTLMGQDYLNALANPGPPRAVGPNVPQAAPPSQSSGVLDQFLANWTPPGGGSGAGGYDNSWMMNALQNQNQNQIGWGSPMGGSTTGTS